MTGFGQAQTKSKTSEFQVSIRTVNGRFLEPRFHIPREFLNLESELRKVLNEHFVRGTVDIFVNRKSLKQGGDYNVVVQSDLASKYVQASKDLKKKFKLKGDFSIEALMKSSEVIKLEEDTSAHKSETEQLMKVFVEACQNCQKERAREGMSLRKEMLQLITELKKLREGMIAERTEANRFLEERFQKKIKERSAELTVEPQRLAQEIVLQLERSDINEELSRLSEHLDQFQILIEAKEAMGKKLDFYTQELLREVNTIGSKSQVAKLTQTVVQAKTIIEKIREQVQNIE